MKTPIKHAFVICGMPTEGDRAVLLKRRFSFVWQYAEGLPAPFGRSWVALVDPANSRVVVWLERSAGEGRSSYASLASKRYCSPGEVAAAAKAGRPLRLSAGFGPWSMRRSFFGDVSIGCQRINVDELRRVLRRSDRTVRTARAARSLYRVPLGDDFVTVRKDGSVRGFGVTMSRVEVRTAGKALINEAIRLR